MPLTIPATDSSLKQLVGATIPSAVAPGVQYRIERRLGGGAMSVAFFALRVGPDGQSPVVLKVHRPDFVRASGKESYKVFCKEAVALGRLNERVPPTPYVVRLFDNGVITVTHGKHDIELPWLAVEYVHGGAAGTTLTDRVGHAMQETGSAFDAWRAAHAVDCLAKGLSAVHEVGVIHRDVKPDNILCCGLAQDEILKVADFGIARPAGIAATFQPGVLGTPGYAPIEIIDSSVGTAGPWSDVFSLACVVYFILTGEDYFPVRSLGDAIVRISSPQRRSLLDAQHLGPELRAREIACRTIDQALTQATYPKPEARQQTIAAFAASVLPYLRTETWRTPVGVARTLVASPQPAQKPWTWLLRHNPTDRVIRSAAWDADGTCLAATTRGLVFWDGNTWRDAPVNGITNPRAIRFVHRIGTGRWLIASEGSTFAIYTTEGVSEVTRFAADWIQLEAFSGELGDLAVAVGATANGPVLLGLTGMRWLKALELEGMSQVTSIARVDDAQWLIVGQHLDGTPLLGIYSPLDWDVQCHHVAQVRKLSLCAGAPGVQVGLAAGSDGVVAWLERGEFSMAVLPGRPEVTAVAVDATGTGWAAAGGKIFSRTMGPRGPEWEPLWEDSPWAAPIVSLFASDNYVVGMTADGGILEGRRVGTAVTVA